MSGAVLQNTAAFYKARYDVAQDHVIKGETDQALDILWDMRLKPDLGLYRRALVNLLIACNADIRDHDCSVFANECLELLKQLQRDGYPPNEGTLLIENHARETLKAIELEEAELKIPKPRAKSTSIIEGMYTDHYGHEEEGEQVEKAADIDPSQHLHPNPTSEIDTAK